MNNNSSGREIEFQNPRGERVLIAMKGLPCTGKSEFAKLLGQWARTTVLYIDDFLLTLSLEKGYSIDSLPSPEEAARAHRVAFDALCNVALLGHRWVNRCVVIKSRFSYAFEVDRLAQLVEERCFEKVIIVDCRTKNEHRWRIRLEDKVKWRGHWEWYKADSWKDIDKAKADCQLDTDRSWDDRLLRLTGGDQFSYCKFRRVVVDSVDDLNLIPRQPVDLTKLNPALLDAINYLLSLDSEQGLYAGRYVVVPFDELRRFLLEIELRAAASRERSKYLCSSSHGRSSSCVFKYWEELIVRGDGGNYTCEVCEERVASGEPAYTCYFCMLALHKSCAELDGFNSPGFTSILLLNIYPEFAFLDLPTTYACKSCLEEGKDFSYECKSCLLHTHFKCRLIPTVISHECHHHFLSLELLSTDVVCKACGTYSHQHVCAYGCYICRRYYHIKCASLPTELVHEHGGYKHVMKLMYTRDGMEPEEDYWCDVCYEDMDPENWFYLCQECPYYEAHADCTEPFREVQDEQFMKFLGSPDSLFSESNPPPIQFFN